MHRNQKRRSSARIPKRKREMERGNDGDVVDCGGAPPLSSTGFSDPERRKVYRENAPNPQEPLRERAQLLYLSRFDFQIFRSGPSAP